MERPTPGIFRGRRYLTSYFLFIFGKFVQRKTTNPTTTKSYGFGFPLKPRFKSWH